MEDFYETKRAKADAGSFNYGGSTDVIDVYRSEERRVGKECL